VRLCRLPRSSRSQTGDSHSQPDLVPCEVLAPDVYHLKLAADYDDHCLMSRFMVGSALPIERISRIARLSEVDNVDRGYRKFLSDR